MSDPKPLSDGWTKMIDENNRRHTLSVRSQLIKLKDEPCSKCGAPAGDFRVFEGLEAAMGKTVLAPAICETCFRLEGGVVYRADFLVVLADGSIQVVDCKGIDTQSSINKRKQVKERYGLDVLLVRKA